MNYNPNLKPRAKIMNDIFLSLLYHDLVLLIIVPCKNHMFKNRFYKL